jgi:hypothetical protein
MMSAWAMEHPIVALCMVWLLADTAVRISRSLLRTINVVVRGWPPSHLDASGDWKLELESKKK